MRFIKNVLHSIFQLATATFSIQYLNAFLRRIIIRVKKILRFYYACIAADYFLSVIKVGQCQGERKKRQRNITLTLIRMNIRKNLKSNYRLTLFNFAKSFQLPSFEIKIFKLFSSRLSIYVYLQEKFIDPLALAFDSMFPFS